MWLALGIWELVLSSDPCLSVTEATLKAHFSLKAAFLGMFLLMWVHTLTASRIPKWPRGHTGMWACHIPVPL